MGRDLPLSLTAQDPSLAQSHGEGERRRENMGWMQVSFQLCPWCFSSDVFPSFGNCLLSIYEGLGTGGATQTHTQTKPDPDSTELIVQWGNRHQTGRHANDQINGSVINAGRNRTRVSESTSQDNLGYSGKVRKGLQRRWLWSWYLKAEQELLGKEHGDNVLGKENSCTEVLRQEGARCSEERRKGEGGYVCCMRMENSPRGSWEGSPPPDRRGPCGLWEEFRNWC